MRHSLFTNPDLLSLDIDGIDYYVAKGIMELGLRPKVFVVEYNSAFGDEAGVTVEYKHDFDISKEHPKAFILRSVDCWLEAFFDKP